MPIDCVLLEDSNNDSPIGGINTKSLFVHITMTMYINKTSQVIVIILIIDTINCITLQWRIQDGAFGANAPPPPHLVEEPAIATSIKLYVRPRSVYILHDILLAITNSLETK